MKRTMEKISILSLSLLLISTYAVSAVLPAMLEHFSDHSRTEVEQLIPITSFAIMIVILLNGWLSKILSERISIILGIILIAAAGSVPVFVQQYEVMFVSRLLLGVGIGLVNFHAINLINKRYEGNERSSLLGFRSAAEMLGNAALTLIAGQLLLFGWNRAFLVYLAAIPVLLLYLCFVPKHASEMKREKVSEQDRKKKSWTDIRGHLGFLISSAFLGAMVICMNSANTLRIPSLVLERGIGTESQASVVLSAMMASGILGGICFGGLARKLKGKMTAVSMMLFGGGMMLIAVSGNMFVLGLGAVLAGASQNLVGTALFNNVGEKLPTGLVSLGTTFVLVGCNLGSSSSALLLKLIGYFSEKMSASFVVYATVMLGFGLIMLLRVYVENKAEKGNP